MNSVLLLLLFVSSLFSVINGQYTDWTCNHYGTYTVDMCFQYSGSLEYLFECNGTDAISFKTYTDGKCGESGATVYTNTIISTSTGLFACDQSSACDVFVVSFYTDEDCTGDSYFELGFVVDQCYSGSGSSLEYSCSGSKLTTKSYTSDDCSGSSTDVTVNYNDYTDTISGCIEISCAGAGGSSAPKLQIYNTSLYATIICIIIALLLH